MNKNDKQIKKKQEIERAALMKEEDVEKLNYKERQKYYKTKSRTAKRVYDSSNKIPYRKGKDDE